MDYDSTGPTGLRRRRDVLRALGATAVAGALAGCGDGEVESFTAERVSLSTPARQRTGFDDESRDGIAEGSSRTENGTEVGVAVVSQVVQYGRTGRGPGDAAGLGVVTIPDASVAGQPVSPLASVGLMDVADGAALPQVLQSAGLGDSLTWPEQPAKVDTTSARLLGSSVTVESWVGVVDDGGDRHVVTSHLAKGTRGDDVVVAGAVTTDRLPANGGQIRPNAVADSEPFAESLADARRLFDGLVVGTDPGTATPTPSPPGPARIFNRNIDQEAHEQLLDMANQGIRCFAFHPDGGWVVITHDNERFARNIPDECYEKLKELKNNGRQIRWVAFPPGGGNSWSVVFDGGFFNRNVPDELHQKMLDYSNQGHQIELVAFPPKGGNSWFLLTDRTTFSRNVPDECYQVIRNIHQGPRRVHHVAFEANDGWVVFADDYYFARNVDGELFSKMQDYAADDDRVDVVAFDTDGTGWSIISNGPVRGGWYDPIRQVERSVDGTSIWQAMRDANTPGVAVAVVEDDELAWATGYGLAKDGATHRAVHPETVFQAASISKTLAAIGAVRMARDGTLNLGQDVNQIMDGWTLQNQLGLTTTNDVTVQRLLSHSGGTNVPGFGGYLSTFSGSVPSVTGVLDGDGNSDPVRVVYDPGTAAQYSGGGYTVVQKCMADASGRSFGDWMQDNVLDPIGMDDSTFEQPLPISWFGDHSVATGHDGSGDPITGGRNIYPESAAAGLYSTVLDLARVVRMLNGDGTIDGTQVLTPGEVQNILTVQTLTNGSPAVAGGGVRGLGYILRNRNNGPLAYQHGGTNEGFRCAYRGYPTLGTGVAVMTNGDDPGLRWDVLNAVVETYGWE